MKPPTVQSPTAWLLPEQTTFVGRAAELDRLSAMLTTARLVTVTGSGGVGKTRLALRAAAAAEAAFPDGVRLVELSALRDPELLANTVAAVLDLSEQDPRPRTDQVLDYLADRTALLVLDTCEHLVEACALFAEAVLSRTSSVTILATSREPLLTPGEHEYPLAPMGVPGPRPGSGPGGIAALPAADEDAAGDAVELFAQRAAAVSPGFIADDASRADIARLCRHLDGMPLAVELAAAQLRTVSLDELMKRMDSRFLDLTARQGDGAGRHRTLRDAIGWSYELCTPAERALWERMAVFAGPADADAARQVCAGPGLASSSVMNALLGLVGKSVLTRTSGDTSRYGMLDTIREYGAERLTASGDGPGVRARHLRRYLALAAELAGHPLEDQVPRHRALRAEHANIRAAIEHAVTLPGDAAADGGHPALQLPMNLEWYWGLGGRFHEGRYWLTRGLESAPGPGPDRIRALIARGYLASCQAELEAALADIEQAEALADDIGDRRLKARALVYRTFALIIGGHLEEGGRTARASRTLLDHDDQADLPLFLILAEAYLELLTGTPEGCMRLCERALRWLPDTGERWGSGYLYCMAGMALTLMGKADEGSRAVIRGLAMKRELDDMMGMAHGLGAAALVAAAQRRPERTAWLIGAADPLWKQFGGTFLGANEMRAVTDQAARNTRDQLGGDRYDAVVRDAASRPVGQVIDMAIRDADRLPSLSSGVR